MMILCNPSDINDICIVMDVIMYVIVILIMLVSELSWWSWRWAEIYEKRYIMRILVDDFVLYEV